MSPRQSMQMLSENTGVSIKVILSVIGIFISVPMVCAGAWINLSITMSDMQNQIKIMSKDFQSTIADVIKDNKYQIDTINQEMDRRRPYIYDRKESWSDHNMDSLQKANEQKLNEAGVNVKLPDVFSIKRNP